MTIFNLRISILSDLICEKKYWSPPWIFDRRICKQNRSEKRNSKQIHSLYICKRNSKIEQRLLAFSNMEQPKLYEGVKAAVSYFKAFYTGSVYCSRLIQSKHHCSTAGRHMESWIPAVWNVWEPGRWNAMSQMLQCMSGCNKYANSQQIWNQYQPHI